MSEMPSAFNSITRKARKEHKCCECGVEIKKGDKYRYSSGIWDGEPDSYKQCSDCHEIMMAASSYDRNNHGDGVAFRELREWFFGFMCIDFKGQNLVNTMANDIGVDAKKLGRLLKI